jgi:hypothetical protein
MVDLFLDYPAPFKELWNRSELAMLRGVPVRVASIGDLIGLKHDAGRPQDLADAEALAHIARIRGDA